MYAGRITQCYPYGNLSLHDPLQEQGVEEVLTQETIDQCLKRQLFPSKLCLSFLTVGTKPSSFKLSHIFVVLPSSCW